MRKADYAMGAEREKGNPNVLLKNLSLFLFRHIHLHDFICTARLQEARGNESCATRLLSACEPSNMGFGNSRPQ